MTEKENNIVDILVRNAINERMDKILLQDEERNKIQKRIDESWERVNNLNLPQEQWRVVNSLVDAYIANGSHFGRMTYMQRIKDCVSLMREMGLIKAS